VKMDRILELARANLTLLVEPGVLTLAIADAAAGAGLLYPPDPGWHDHRRARHRAGKEKLSAEVRRRRANACMRELRRVLDPNGMLNPGKMFD